MRAILLASLCALPFASRGAVPEVLIVQEKLTPKLRAEILKRIQGREPPKEDSSADFPEVPIANVLATEIDADGRVFPIVWGLSDPIFRAAVEERKIRGDLGSPSVGDGQDAARRLNAEYLLVAVAWREKDAVHGSARLYAGRREIWRDDRMMAAQQGGEFDEASATLSLARTWSQVMATGPLKDLPPQRRQKTPEPDPGTKPVVHEPPPSAPEPGIDSKKVLEDAMRLLASGQRAAALNLLRDAVDEEPLAPERRLALANVLLRLQMPELAAKEARRGAELFPNAPGFRVLAARAWIAARNRDEAFVDLNAALARDADDPEARLLVGELQLYGMRLPYAIEHFDHALARAPTGQGHFLRGLARMLLSDGAGAQSDWEAAKLLDAAPDADRETDRYRTGIRVLDSAGEALAAEVRELIQQVRLNASEPNVRDAAAAAAKRASSLVALSDALSAPEAHRSSHERRSLALKLLRQAASETQALLDKPSQDPLTEAAITLGEGMKQLEAAREAFQKEASLSE